jgi:membrane dipeptidase
MHYLYCNKRKVLMKNFYVISTLILAGILFLKYFGNDNNSGLMQSDFNTSNNSFMPNDTTPKDVFQPVEKFKNVKEDYLPLHYDAIVVDTHNDFIWKVYDKGYELGIRNKNSQSDIPKFRDGGVDIQFFAVWIPMKEVKSSLEFTKKQIAKLKEIEKENADDFEIAYTYDDIRRIVNAKKLCGLIGVEGGTAVENDAENINTLYDLGVRYISITWNNSNSIASSANDENSGKKGGLTDFGKTVIKKMDDAGMLIDVSHLGEKSFWDIAALSKNPIIASHSNCYTINPHYRNLTDDQIKAIAKSGGVVMVNFHNDFTVENAKPKAKNVYDFYKDEIDSLVLEFPNDPVKLFQAKLQYLDRAGESDITADAIIAHIDYIKNLVGVDYVGIGADLDGGITLPYDLYDVSCLPRLTQKMAEKGYSEIEIRKILGLNFLRVYKQVCG